MRRPKLTTRRFLVAVAVAGASLPVYLGFASTSATTTVAGTDIADAYAAAGRPTQNFGLKNEVFAKAKGDTAYLRFSVDLPAGATVQGMQVEFYATQTASTGFDVRPVAAGGSWTETGLTWKNQPGADLSGAPLATQGRIRSVGWFTLSLDQPLPVTNGTVELVLVGAGSSIDHIASRESSHDPVLDVQVSLLAPAPSGSDSGTPTPSGTDSASATPSDSPTTSPTDPSPSVTTSTTAAAAGPCTGAAAPARWSHVIWIVMENHSYSDVIGNAAAPYETSLAHSCAVGSSYFAITHPSLPNYLAMTGGSTFGVNDDNGPSSHPIDAASIFSEVRAAGREWRSYEESMPSNCYLSSSGLYAPKHNPATYYTGIRTDCANWDVPMGTTTNGAFADDLANDTLPAFSFVTPDLCDDTHNSGCTVTTGDGWLQQWLPQIFASPAYTAGDTAVFLTWDEDDSSQHNQVPLLAMAPSITPGTNLTAHYDHYSLLRTTEDLLGLTTHAGAAAQAASMRTDLGL